MLLAQDVTEVMWPIGGYFDECDMSGSEHLVGKVEQDVCDGMHKYLSEEFPNADVYVAATDSFSPKFGRVDGDGEWYDYEYDYSTIVMHEDELYGQAVDKYLPGMECF